MIWLFNFVFLKNYERLVNGQRELSLLGVEEREEGFTWGAL